MALKYHIEYWNWNVFIRRKYYFFLKHKNTARKISIMLKEYADSARATYNSCVYISSARFISLSTFIVTIHRKTEHSDNLHPKCKCSN